MTDEQFHIVLKNDLSEITRLGQELESFGNRNGLPMKTLFELRLILEEVLANVIAYAYEDNLRHEIAVGVALRSGTITIAVEDDGRPFNPLLVPPPSTDRSLQTMPIGGLGLHLVRSLTDSIEYERAGRANRLTVRKKAESATS